MLLGALAAGITLFATVADARAQMWTLAWSDEFNGATPGPPNTNVWNFDLGNSGFGNNELETYCGPPGYANNPQACPTAFSVSTSNAYVDGNGHLVIQAINNGGIWTSARLNTATNPPKTFQYGRIEASEKLPIGAGLWPAFWAYGSNISTVGWPMCGEIDYMENVPALAGLGPTIISSTMHGPGYSGGNGLSQKYTFPSGDVTSFHTYGAIWSPFMVQFYVDDPANVFFIRTASDVPSGSQWAFNHPFLLLTNLAVGGNWPGPPNATTPNPSVMMADFVRYYQAAQVPPPNLGNPADISVAAGGISGTTTVNLLSQSGSGRVFLNCMTSAPNFSCAINTGYTLNPSVADFTTTNTATAKVTVNRTSSTVPMPAPLVFIFNEHFVAVLASAEFFIFVLLFMQGILRKRNQWRRWAHLLALGGLVLAGTIVLSCGGGSSPSSATQPPSNYSVTVNAYTVSGNGAAPDATVNINMAVLH
jgi:beta-glucanase (GH16 family)